MNLQDILIDISSKSFVKQLGVLEDTLLSSENLKLYAQHYIEINGTVAKETKIHIYVFNEGLEIEDAYYKDREPIRTIDVEHPLVVKYQSIIESVKGKVIDKGEGFIVVTGYESDGLDGMLPKTWFAEEIEGALSVKEIK